MTFQSTPCSLIGLIWPALLYVQSMTIGVWPEAIVVGAGSIGMKLPLSASFFQKSMPGWMLSAEPPLASAAMTTPLKPADALVGSPFSAILPLYFGSARSATFLMSPSEAS